MDKQTKIVIFSVLGMLVLGGGITAIVLYKNKKDVSDTETQGSGGSTTDDDKPNLDALLNNMGVAASKSQDGTSVNASFNEGKNTVSFFSNGRYAVKDNKSGQVRKGYWSSGGKKITPDGRPMISSGSVWQNLLNLLK